MKTFGLWMILFVGITIFFAYVFRDWQFQDVLILGTIFSYVMYRLLKEEMNE